MGQAHCERPGGGERDRRPPVQEQQQGPQAAQSGSVGARSPHREAGKRASCP